MENTTSRNSIILKNISSPYIEQAIFILKKETEFEDDIVEEAQKIVNNFIKRRQKKNKINRCVKKILSIASVITVIILACTLVYFSLSS